MLKRSKLFKKPSSRIGESATEQYLDIAEGERPYFHWEDFQIGREINVYGRVFVVCALGGVFCCVICFVSGAALMR